MSGRKALDEVIGELRAETPLEDGEVHFRTLLEKLPAGAYTCDREGLITYFNQSAVQLWGRAPALNDPADRYCGSFKLFSTDGAPIGHDRCWMALALQTDEGYNEREIVVERPDGQRLTALAHANPIHGTSGELIGAVNVLVDITDRKRAEEELLQAREAERQRMARDLHDEVLQDLAYALTATQLVQGAVGDDAAEERLGQAIEALKRAGRGVRDAIYDLRAEDERKDLGEVLEALSIGDAPTLHTEPGLETRSGMDSSSTGEPEDELDGGVARVLLVEDHASFRDAVASVFEGEPGYTVVGQAGSLAEARELLDGVDIAVIDLALPDGFGGEIVEELRVRNPQAQALVLSAYSERREVARAVESGAAGVLHKSVGMEEVLDAVRRLKAGDTILPLEEVVELLRYASSRKVEEQEGIEAIARLTQREREVLRLLAEGLDSRGIAERLNISIKTERHHAASILAKFGAHSRLQALVFALRHDIVRVT